MKHFKLPKSRKRGYDLFQIGVAVMIGIILFGAGVRLLRQVNNSAEASIKARDIVAVASEIRAQFRTDGTYASMDGVTDLVSSDFGVASGFPDAMIDYMEIGTADDDSFEIVLNNLNNSICARLAKNDYGPYSSASCNSGTLTVTFNDS